MRYLLLIEDYIFSVEQLQKIKAFTEIYRYEVNRINDLINTQQSEDRLDKLYRFAPSLHLTW